MIILGWVLLATFMDLSSVLEIRVFLKYSLKSKVKEWVTKTSIFYDRSEILVYYNTRQPSGNGTNLPNITELGLGACPEEG